MGPCFTAGTSVTASRYSRQEMKVPNVIATSIKPALQFTSEGEENNQISYLDVMVIRKNGKILPTVFSKPTFSGQYVKWNCFCHESRKIPLIKTLTLRALRICSPSFWELELYFIKAVFLENGL